MSVPANICNDLRCRLERTFSIPFDVSSSVSDGDEHYICVPVNEDDGLFSVDVHVQNWIRLVVMVRPQKHAGNMLLAMAGADDFKRRCFREYWNYLKEQGFRIRCLVNRTEMSGTSEWPEKWRPFSLRMTKIPLPDLESVQVKTDVIEDGMNGAITLMLTLLDVEDTGAGLPDELPDNEGERRLVVSARYERNPVNRALCLLHKGYVCSVCGFDFGRVYGEIGKNYIEVHHVMPVSLMGPDYHFDVDRDMVPVCSNCHSMLHRRNPPYTVGELQAVIADNGHGSVGHTVADVSGSDEIRSFIDSVIQNSPEITLMQLLPMVVSRYSPLYPDMSTGDWHFIVGKYYYHGHSRKSQSS